MHVVIKRLGSKPLRHFLSSIVIYNSLAKTNLEILIKLVSQKRESFPKDNFDILPSSSTKDNSSN